MIHIEQSLVGKFYRAGPSPPIAIEDSEIDIVAGFTGQEAQSRDPTPTTITAPTLSPILFTLKILNVKTLLILDFV
jgi:hypothetical protein